MSGFIQVIKVRCKENSRPPRTRSSKKKSSRNAPLQDHNTGSASSGSQEDPGRIRELEGLLREAQDRLRATEVRLGERGDAVHGSPTRRNESRVPAPSRLSDITMEEIRTQLGYDKKRWNALRACIRDCLSAARLDWNHNWKSQSTTKRGYAYNAVEDDFPELRRFEGQWAVNHIAKNVWDNRKTYINCIDNPSTYFGRRAAQRHLDDGVGGTGSRRASSPTPAPSVRNITPPPQESPTRSSSAGPSQLRPQLRRRARAPSSSSSSSSDDEDDLLEFDDDQDPDSAGQEGEREEGEANENSGTGTKRAKSSGGSSSKRQKH
ncbi:hypothetical protein MSAN_01634500 [Mycena sanguinolenta]|uniref:Uncharacterized protein n=1 Tax=Mycena sanguinolenta TaxID=230812 RepID=A0A8H6Y2G4_9AGAR|nr:hypothetical protein MSAN_01634500 [Mycena sanguinolenta]